MPFIHHPWLVAEGVSAREFVPLPVNLDGVNWLYAVSVLPVGNDVGVARITIYLQPDQKNEDLAPIILADDYINSFGIGWTGRIPIAHEKGPIPSIRVDAFQETGAVRNFQIVILWESQ
jgi:hypothetical protein